jgi:hypothetical protein
MRRLRARPGPGAAEVKFPATRTVEIKADHRVQAVVLVELDPTARPKGALMKL